MESVRKRTRSRRRTGMGLQDTESGRWAQVAAATGITEEARTSTVKMTIVCTDRGSKEINQNGNRSCQKHSVPDSIGHGVTVTQCLTRLVSKWLATTSPYLRIAALVMPGAARLRPRTNASSPAVCRVGGHVAPEDGRGTRQISHASARRRRAQPAPSLPCHTRAQTPLSGAALTPKQPRETHPGRPVRTAHSSSRSASPARATPRPASRPAPRRARAAAPAPPRHAAAAAMVGPAPDWRADIKREGRIKVRTRAPRLARAPGAAAAVGWMNSIQRHEPLSIISFSQMFTFFFWIAPPLSLLFTFSPIFAQQRRAASALPVLRGTAAA